MRRGKVQAPKYGFHDTRFKPTSRSPQDRRKKYRLPRGHFEGFRKLKVREAINMIERDGWVICRTRGSHRQYRHAEKRGLVTIPGKLKDDLAPGTVNSILKQAGLKP